MFCLRLDISRLLQPAVNTVSFLFHELILIDIRKSYYGKRKNVLCIYVSKIYSEFKLRLNFSLIIWRKCLN